MVYPYLDPEPITRTLHQRDYAGPKEIFEGRDDEKWFRKSAVLTMYTGGLAGLGAMSKINLLPDRKNPGLASSISVVKSFAVPLVGMGLAYTTGVYLASNIRKKPNDPINHWYGGLAAGLVAGKVFKSIHTGIINGLFFGVVGLLVKEAATVEDGVVGWPLENLPKRRGGPFAHKHDWTMYKEIEGYWVRDKKDIPRLMERGMVDKGYGYYGRGD